MVERASRMAELGLTVRAARIDRGWSQMEVADAAGVSRPSIARIERGEDVSTATLEKVAGALGLTLELKDQARGKHAGNGTREPS